MGVLSVLRVMMLSSFALQISAFSTQADDADDCGGNNIDISIRGCSALISQGGRYAELGYQIRALQYLNKGEYNKAIADFNVVIRQYSDKAGAYSGRGTAYFRLKSYKAAISDFDVALKLKPRDPVANRYRPLAKQALSSLAESKKPESSGSSPQTDKPKGEFKDCSDCPSMVVVPAGSFIMGSPEGEERRLPEEGPQRTVTIAKSFAVGKFSVTVDEFAAFVKATGYDAGSECWTDETGESEKRTGRSWRNPGFSQKGSHPVVCVNWYDARAYLTWLSGRVGKTYRLLSEAEWEYAARAGTKTPFWWGASISTKQANYNGASPYGEGEYRRRTVAVDSFAPNPFGLYQMQGNVWQWVEDCFVDGYQNAPLDGSARTARQCDARVLRGGSWRNGPAFLRAARRDGDTPDMRTNIDGFRVARSLDY